MDKSDKSEENGPREYCTLHCTLQIQLKLRAHANITAGIELETLRIIFSIQTGISKSSIPENLHRYRYLYGVAQAVFSLISSN